MDGVQSFKSRGRGVARAAQAAATVGGAAIAVPVKAREAVIRATGAAYAGIGDKVSPIPTASTDNTISLAANTDDRWTLDRRNKVDQYIYVYAVAATVDVTVQFYG